MADALLILTFTPVQSFIAEARRISDLYAGSQILVQLAKAAAQEIGAARLIYPAPLDGALPDDVPNILVARVDDGSAEEIAHAAHDALLRRWQQLTDEARHRLAAYVQPDKTWAEIWGRQTEGLWQIFWVTVSMDGQGYRETYQTARAALTALKRSRIFPQVQEPGVKDSLSGKRQALHRGGESAREHWANVARRAGPSRLRPAGRERLDAIGATKRFCSLADKSFPSTSSIASADFLEMARRKASGQLSSYRRAIEEALGSHIYKVRHYDHLWPYDGDLLFLETLTVERLQDSYHGVARPEKLEMARDRLLHLYRVVKARPSPYYAVFVLDGDSMGAHIRELLERPNPEDEHRRFSRQLAEFATEVPQVMDKEFSRVVPATGAGGSGAGLNGRHFLVYNGGDDVLTFAPLSAALPMAQALARTFSQRVPGCSASAGVAVVHHLYPLDAALAAAREAEGIAKGVTGKAAVAVTVVRRSGELLTMRSRWANLGDLFDAMVDHFAQGRLSSRFAHDLAERASTITALPPDARRAALKQLLHRHGAETLVDPDSLAGLLGEWAQALDGQVPPEKAGDAVIPQGLVELARWVLFARFVAQGGAA